MFLFYLGDGLFSGAFQLEFHHVDVVRSFYHEVNPSFGRMIFCLGIETYQFEIQKFVREIRSGQPEAFLKRLQTFFADTPYELASELKGL